MSDNRQCLHSVGNNTPNIDAVVNIVLSQVATKYLSALMGFLSCMSSSVAMRR